MRRRSSRKYIRLGRGEFDGRFAQKETKGTKTSLFVAFCSERVEPMHPWRKELIPTQFSSFDGLVAAAADLLKSHFQLPCSVPHAVMLSGGRTPLPIYDVLIQNPVRVSKMLHILFTDERMVPTTSEESNAGRVFPMLSALGVSSSSILGVDTELPLEEAVEAYDKVIAEFLDRGGRVTLALLGVGSDGHTASLFSMDDIERSRGRWAVGVRRKDGPDRVSVSADTIAKAEHAVILAAGKEKRDVVERMRTHPEKVVAAHAVKDAQNAELWYCG